MVLGTIGIIVVVVGVMMININNPYRYGHLIAIIGLSLVLGYIDFLEGRAGISTKYRWIRFIILVFALIVLYLIFQSFY